MVVAGEFFREQLRLQAIGRLWCTHKTAALGVPLINSMYSNDAPAFVGLYTASNINHDEVEVV